MKFFAITGQNIDELFFNTTYEISKKIEEGYYDLNDSKCGIKKGNEFFSNLGNKNQYSNNNKKNTKCLII